MGKRRVAWNESVYRKRLAEGRGQDKGRIQSQNSETLFNAERYARWRNWNLSGGIGRGRGLTGK